MNSAQSARVVSRTATRPALLRPSLASTRYQSTTPPTRPTQQASDKARAEESKPQQDKTKPALKKTVAEQDAELRTRLEAMSGEGGAAGVEYENGSAEGLKKQVKSNMFRLI